MKEKMKYLNTTKKILTFLVSAALALNLFFSCSNLLSLPSAPDSNDLASNNSSSTGKIKVAIDLEETSSRSALPSAFPTGGSSFVFAGAIHDQGTDLTASMFKIAEASVVSGSDNKQMSVSIPFQVSSSLRENYILEIYAFPNGTTTITSLSTAYLCGNTKITIGAKEISVVVSDTIKMLPNTSSTEKGSVDLKISIPDGCTLSAKCTTTGHTSESFGCAKSSGIYSVTASNLSPGDHTVTFLIEKGGRVASGWTEVIKVYPTLVTDRWTSGNVNASGVRVISSVELDTTYYVRGTPVSGIASDSWFADITDTLGNDTTGDGSILKPYATVQKAIDSIKTINDGSTEYTIYVDGKVTATGGVGAVAQIDMESTKLNLTISGLGSEKAVLDGGRVTNASVVSASGANLTLTLEKLKITGAKIPLDNGDIYGGGVHAWDGTYTFNDCEISGNQARHGGGVAFRGGKPFVMDNCVVNGNKAVYGGGILIRYGTLTLKSGTVIGDKTLTSYATSENHGNMSIGNGGGVTLSGEWGSADPTLIVESGCYIAGNYCDASNGNGDNSASGGVCMQQAAKLQLKEGAFIQYNFADAYNSNGGKGGGILITSSAKSEDIIILGNIIGNRATVNGGGIYNDGKTVVIAPTANISGNFSPKGKGIYNNGILKMAGAVKIPATDDVFLASGKTVTVTASLTGTTPVAKITPESYPSDSTDVQVLDGDATLVSESCGKFVVTAQRDGTEWKIDENGKLKKTVITVPEIDVTTALGKISNPDSNPLNINVKIMTEHELLTLAEKVYTCMDNGTSIKLIIADSSTITALPLPGWGGLFSDCTNLLSVVIPSKITSIAAGTFTGCTNLASVTFKNTSGWTYDDGGVSESADVSNPSTNASNFVSGVWQNKELTKTAMPASAAIDLLKSSESAGQPVSIEVSVNEDNLAALLDALRKTDASEVSIVIDAEDITTLDPGSFSGMSTLTQVEIKGSVTTIADSAFGSCTNLESVIISGNVTTIGSNAFSNCDQLTSVEVGEGVTEIGTGAFSGCDNLSEINLPNSLETIGERAFTENAATEINIPEGVKEIKEGAFSNCSKIRKITLPSTLEKMAKGAFSNCAVLAEVIFKNPIGWYITSSGYSGGEPISVSDPSLVANRFKPGAQSADNKNWYRVAPAEENVAAAISAISSATGFISLDVTVSSNADLESLARAISTAAGNGAKVELSISENSTITEIPDTCFESNLGLVCLKLPSCITSIGKDAFQSCENLTTIILPDTMNSIGESAFYDCSKLTVIDIPRGIDILNQYVFGDCISLTEINVPEGVKIIDFSAFTGCENLSKVTLPSTLTFIGPAAFENCINIKSITIPKKVYKIERSAFSFSYGTDYSLESVIFEEKTGWYNATPPNYTGGNTVDVSNPNANATNLINSEFNWYRENVVLSVGDAFAELKSTAAKNEAVSMTVKVDDGELATLANAVKNTSATSVDLVLNVTGNNVSIGNAAFSACYKLRLIVIPEGVTELGRKAFEWCNNLERVVLPSSLTSIETSTFENCTALTSAVFTNKTGWKYKDDRYASSGIVEISATDLNDEATAANFLKMGKYLYK